MQTCRQAIALLTIQDLEIDRRRKNRLQTRENVGLTWTVEDSLSYKPGKLHFSDLFYFF